MPATMIKFFLQFRKKSKKRRFGFRSEKYKDTFSAERQPFVGVMKKKQPGTSKSPNRSNLNHAYIGIS